MESSQEGLRTSIGFRRTKAREYITACRHSRDRGFVYLDRESGYGLITICYRRFFGFGIWGYGSDADWWWRYASSHILLNSCSGLAASAAGFVIGNNVLIVAGCLVGASGLILTVIM